MSGVWVWIDHADGNIAAISLEALGVGRQVADTLGQPLTALVTGHEVQSVADAAFKHGADAVLGADDETLADFRVEAHGPLVAGLAQEREPSAIIAGASTRGRDLTGWVAAQLDAGLAPDGIEVSAEDGKVVLTRPVYAGKLLGDIYVTDGLQIISLRSRAFPAAEETGGSGSAEWVDPVVAEEDIPTKVIGFESSAGQVSLTDARIIASGGRGVGGPEGFEPIRELADVLGGALGASRATVDAGWIPYEHQVGQTGKTVSPDLYIASGISGAIQHQAGMRTSKVIVAINTDADAPIFKIAHYGIVGDLFEVVPALSEEFRKRLGG
ncbi:MAG TPA: electron transfer flavoprotein subunit alpha/FixB family protein [Candidatus Sulfomarinibacteraceae bacterium]|nr:electron transfer flavoprotein subunit alpha/FixB family protein [Candidatus Sulfomarinibacteraceae bacterium]